MTHRVPFTISGGASRNGGSGFDHELSETNSRCSDRAWGKPMRSYPVSQFPIGVKGVPGSCPKERCVLCDRCRHAPLKRGGVTSNSLSGTFENHSRTIRLHAKFEWGGVAECTANARSKRLGAMGGGRDQEQGCPQLRQYPQSGGNLHKENPDRG